ncbi:uncharacterized protein LOC113557695 [Rhopalosiphum maidis]|uniref:uncharacterized protein LOC113557695 n=1 Tax=Rhopalosiphum maidis TaxID=43146 RepID=UPI000F003309|nr:uncharacterized protein LOC113557695 [Rhopalosiphum maidis]
MFIVLSAKNGGLQKRPIVMHGVSCTIFVEAIFSLGGFLFIVLSLKYSGKFGKRVGTAPAINIMESKLVVSNNKGIFVMNGFRYGLQPDKIISLKQLNNSKRFFLMKWKETEDITYVRASTAKKHCPLLVIEFYQRLIQWNDN